MNTESNRTPGAPQGSRLEQLPVEVKYLKFNQNYLNYCVLTFHFLNKW